MSNFISFVEDSFNNIDNKLNTFSVRKKAFEKFKEIGIPTRKFEDWKYLNLAFLNKLNYNNSNLENKVSKEKIEELLIPNITENLIVLVNGKYNSDLSLILDKDLIIKEINDALEESENLKYFEKNIDTSHPFSLLNSALFNSGVFLKVKSNLVLENPVHIINIFDNDVNTSFINTKNLVVAESSSNLKIIQSYHNIGKSDYILNTSTEFVLDKNAYLYHYNFQNDREDSVIFSYNHCSQEKDSIFSDSTITLNGKLVRNDLRSKLNDENIETYYNGLYLIDGNSVVDNHTFVDHIAPNCHSNEFYKGIIDDSAKAIFNGKVYVHQEAQKTDAYQQNRNLVISDNGAIYTKPELEIYADDVKCSHGATTGKIDESQLFYMMQRGLSRKKSKALLMYTFCAEIISRIDVPEMKHYIEDLVLKRLKVDLEKIDI